jgi:hypothetical protein
MKTMAASQPKKDTRDNWSEDLQKFMEARKKEIPLPEIFGAVDILKMDEKMSEGIYEAYIRSTKDSNEAIENLTILRNRFLKGRHS